VLHGHLGLDPHGVTSDIDSQDFGHLVHKDTHHQGGLGGGAQGGVLGLYCTRERGGAAKLTAGPAATKGWGRRRSGDRKDQ
jgi:hypothetical protein